MTFNSAETTATRWAVQKNNNQSWSYSCFADVTDEITGDGNGMYTVGHYYDMTDYPLGDTGDQWAYAGWSLVMIYSHPDEEAHQIYLYDNFLYADNDTYFPFTITGFEAPQDWMEIEGRLTCFVGEGDWCYGDHRYDYWSEATWGDTDWIKFNGEYLNDPSDTEPPSNDNVWNGMSGVSTFIDGVDFDEWDVSNLINPGDTWAEIELGTGVDSWNLIYILLSIRADVGEGQLAYDVGTMSYQIGEE